jgi:hypothetical protein
MPFTATRVGSESQYCRSIGQVNDGGESSHQTRPRDGSGIVHLARRGHRGELKSSTEVTIGKAGNPSIYTKLPERARFSRFALTELYVAQLFFSARSVRLLAN